MFYQTFILLWIIIINVTVISGKKQNVLLIILDDFRPIINNGFNDTKAITPNIDKLISSSHYFTKTFAQQALCGPSRNSLLTSRSPDTLHLYDFYNYWRSMTGNFTTMPQYFKEHGYITKSVGKVFHPGISSNFTDDFPLSWSEETFHPSTEKYMNAPVCVDNETGELVKNLICPVNIEFQPEQTLPDIESMLKAKSLLNDFRETLKPFFLAVGFHKPHVPFKIPFKFLKQHNLSNFELPDFSNEPYLLPNCAWNPWNDIRLRADVKKLNLPFPYGPMEKHFGMQIRQAYYAAVTYVDNLIGELLSSVNLNDTIVILTGDHGWSLGEHSEWSKFSNFDVALRVPLIIHTPDSNKHQIDNVVELLDIFPTIVDLVNLPPLEKCDRNSKNITTCTEGKSLLPLMINTTSNVNSDDDYYAFSQYPRPGDNPTLHPNSDKPKLHQIKIMGYSIRTSQYRYTLWIKYNPKLFTKDWNNIHGEEFYDHSIDPDENMNLITRHELYEIIAELKRTLIQKFQ